MFSKENMAFCIYKQNQTGKIRVDDSLHILGDGSESEPILYIEHSK